jgi:Leucine-rich repeat (LRR) protein
VAILRLNQSWFKDKPYSKNDFEIDRIEPSYFRIRNNHHEQAHGAWAVIEWHAEGTRQKAGNTNSNKDQLMTTIKKLGGQVQMGPGPAEVSLTSLDLHRTRATDEDLKLVQGLTGLRTLNLYGTKITDAGLVNLRGLTGLHVLQLNSTSITDQGLQYLQGLVNLEELGLHRTQITDDGLQSLKNLTHLQKLALGGNRISDRGLTHLKGLRSLKELTLEGTSVTDAGVKDFQGSLPHVMIIR